VSGSDRPVALVTGASRGLGAVLADMREAGWGRVVHIGSDVVARLPLGNSGYAAAKSAQLGLARVWAKELGRQHRRIARRPPSTWPPRPAAQ
jgi:NAD(P)-dependent dehydrogenase (short-subunit alcohol dehydrogenase family)